MNSEAIFIVVTLVVMVLDNRVRIVHKVPIEPPVVPTRDKGLNSNKDAMNLAINIATAQSVAKEAVPRGPLEQMEL